MKDQATHFSEKMKTEVRGEAEHGGEAGNVIVWVSLHRYWLD